MIKGNPWAVIAAKLRSSSHTPNPKLSYVANGDNATLSTFSPCNNKYKVHTCVVPEPWIGNIVNPKVIILNANPGGGALTGGIRDGWDDLNPAERKVLALLTANQLTGIDTDKENLLTNLCGVGSCTNIAITAKTPAGKHNIKNSYWYQSLRIFDKFNVEPKDIAIFEAHGYHSMNFKPFKNLLPSQEYSIKLINDLIRKNPDIVVIIARQGSFWKTYLHNELALLRGKGQVYVKKNPRCKYISDNNIILL